jgi:hypothetical protein
VTLTPTVIVIILVPVVPYLPGENVPKLWYLYGGWRGVWPPSWGRLARRRTEPGASHTAPTAILTTEEFGKIKFVHQEYAS